MTDNASKTQPLIDEAELSRLAPEKLVAGFTQTPVGRFTLIAVLLHVVVIFGTSLPFIYDTWINPEAAAARQAQVEAERKAEQDAKLNAASATGSQTPDENATPDEPATRSRVEQRVEETAAPDELPSLDALLTDNP